MAPRKNDADEVDGDYARLPPLPAPRRWEQRSEACCGASLVSLGKRSECEQVKKNTKHEKNAAQKTCVEYLFMFETEKVVMSRKKRQKIVLCFDDSNVDVDTVFFDFTSVTIMKCSMTSALKNIVQTSCSTSTHASYMLHTCLSMPPAFQKSPKVLPL